MPSVCQSCGMPLSRDTLGGGTEQNGSKSPKYCSHCYILGSFIEPNITSIEMQEKVKAKIKEMMPFPFSLLAGFFSRNIPNLERWKKSN